MALESLRVVDFSDRELLLILNDVADGDGWAYAQDMANRINLDHEHPNRSVASRLSWLVRFGAVEREHLSDEHGNLMWTRSGRPKYGQRWRLTPIGRTYALATLTKAERSRLAAVDGDKMLLVTKWLAEQYRQSPDAGASLMKREWTYGTSPLRALDNGATPPAR